MITLCNNSYCVNNSQGLIKLQELVKNPPKQHMEFLIRQGSPETYRAILKEIKQKEIYNVIVDTKPEHMNHFLRGVSTKMSVN